MNRRLAAFAALAGDTQVEPDTTSHRQTMSDRLAARPGPDPDLPAALRPPSTWTPAEVSAFMQADKERIMRAMGQKPLREVEAERQAEETRRAVAAQVEADRRRAEYEGLAAMEQARRERDQRQVEAIYAAERERVAARQAEQERLRELARKAAEEAANSPERQRQRAHFDAIGAMNERQQQQAAEGAAELAAARRG